MATWSFAEPPHLPLVLPSILSADFASLGEDSAGVLAAGADGLHIDVMDGHFVPNLTMGPAIVRSLRAALPDAMLDVHLMVQDPAAFAEPFVEAGANHLTFHAEVLDRNAAIKLAERVRTLGASAGIAINPDTPASAALEVVEAFELVLVMSVQPGFSGQAFRPEVVDKVSQIREAAGGRVRIQMDGGISPANGELVRNAGCDTLVAASAIFGKPEGERAAVIAALAGRG
ncbi:MAG: ribulose-phosphate 3-epimerase [Planctomycetota bacterium]